MKTDSGSHTLCRFALPLLLFFVLIIAGCPNQEPSTPAPSSRVIFVVPAQLPDGKVGVPYGYSFCKPDAKSTDEACGVNKAPTNPSGGNAPYKFVFSSGSRSPVSGLSLDWNGLLGGTPDEAGKQTFEVCAIDVNGYGKCQNTTLAINPGIKPPAPIKCNTDSDCATKVCIRGVCMQQTGCEGVTCAACKMDADCGTAGICMVGTCWIPAVSVICTVDKDCSSNLCEGGKCVDCGAGFECHAGVCKGGDCVQTSKCTEDRQCSSNLCEGGECVGCSKDSDCATGQCDKGICTSPTVIGNTGWTGIWEGNDVEVEYKPVAGTPVGWALDGCVMEEAIRLNLTQNGNEVTGTETFTVTKATAACGSAAVGAIGTSGTAPVKWTVTGNSADCSSENYANLDASDCTLTLTGNNLSMKSEACHYPDPRCTCKGEDPRCYLGPGMEGGAPMYAETLPFEWFSGENNLVRTK